MSEGIEISRGGAIAVDTEELRRVGARVRTLGAEVGEIARRLTATVAALDGLGIRGRGIGAAVPAISAAATDLDEAGVGAALMGDAYEVVELRARADALALSDAGEAMALRGDADRIIAAHPAAGPAAASLIAGWEQRRFAGFAPSPRLPWPGEPAFGLAGLLAPLWLAAVGGAGKGVVPRVPLAPRSGEVRVDPSPAAVVVAPPATLSETAARIPSTSAQVRVETYTMADGSRRFVAYVDGTRRLLPGEEPWDMGSNATAYLGHEESDSYLATVAALRDAGAGEGDPVDLVGYSQGGMVVGLVAQSGDFDVRTVVTFGSPIAPELPDGVLGVTLRHTDDLVGSLSAGGAAAGTGAAGSIVIERVGAPGEGGLDPELAAHRLDAYRATAELADGSGDPRVGAVHRRLGELGEAVDIRAVDYTASRP